MVSRARDLTAKRTRTPEAIRAEIASLAKHRDALLRAAPMHLMVRRLILPLMLVLPLAGLVVTLRHGSHSVSHLVVLLVFTAALGSACYDAWRPGLRRDDPWTAADRVGFEVDPRELQGQIEALEAELRGRA